MAKDYNELEDKKIRRTEKFPYCIVWWYIYLL